MSGPGLGGKDCLDFFTINTGNLTESPIDFSMKILPDISYLKLNTLVRNISILVTLRKDIIFNISTVVTQGNINCFVPFNVQVNNLNANITHGDILFDLTNCILEGNITGIGNHSNIELKTYDIQCTRDSLWYLKNGVGEVKFDIYQSIEMGANITAIAELDTAEALGRVFYNDFSSNIGATLYLFHWNDYFPASCTWDGFDYIDIDTLPEKSFIFTSFDFPTLNNYNISFYRNNLEAWLPYFWNLYSEPI
jgi:hypothetical protein